MSEPANQIYDDEQKISEDKPKSGATKAELKKAGPTSIDSKKSLEADELSRAEEGEYSDTNQPQPDAPEKNFYKPNTKKSGRFSPKQKFVTGGALAVIIGGIIMLFSLIPLRLTGYLANINQRVFAGATHAMETRMTTLFERYLVTRTFVSMKACGTKVSIDCKRASYADAGIAGSLFKAWQDARIEERLFDKYGIQMEYDRNLSEYRLYDRRGNRIRISDDGALNTNFLRDAKQPGRYTITDEIMGAIKADSKWEQVKDRRAIRRLIERKYDGKRWCFLACSDRDRVNQKYSESKLRVKYRIVERVVYPFSERMGLYFDCTINRGGRDKCSPEAIRKRNFSKLSPGDAADIIDRFQKNPNTRLNHIVLEKLVTKIFGETAGKAAASSVPIAGQVYAALVIVDLLDRIDGAIADNKLSNYAADLTSAQYVEFYTAMRTANDEMKSHQLSLDEVQAVNELLDGSEKTKLYQAYNNPVKTAFWNPFGKTYAQSHETGNESSLCANGQPIPDDEYICKEKKVARTFLIEEIRDNPVVSGVAQGLNLYAPIRGIVRPVLDGIGFVVGTIVGSAFSVIEKVPIVGDALEGLKAVFSPLIGFVMDSIFHLPLQADSTGDDNYVGLEGGGELVARDFGQGGINPEGEEYGLGGIPISDEQYSQVLFEQMEQDRTNYQNKGFLARLIDTENPNSFVLRLAMSIPSDPLIQVQQFVASGVRTISSILSFDLSAMFNLLNFNKLAYAAQPSYPTKSPFGLSKTGYPLDDSSFFINPAELTEDRCSEIQEAREASKTEDPLTGFETYTVINPCMLDRVLVDSAGLLYGLDSEAGRPSQPQVNFAPPSSDSSASLNQLQQEIANKCNSGTVDARERCAENVVQSSIVSRCASGTVDARARCATNVYREAYPCYNMTGAQYDECYKNNYPDNWAHTYNIPPRCENKKGRDLFLCLERN